MSCYKYVVFERKDILENGQVRFTQPGALNDPFEMKLYFKKAAEPEELKAKLHSVLTSATAQELIDNLKIVLKYVPGMPPEEAQALMIRVTESHSAEVEQKILEFFDHLVDTPSPDLDRVVRSLFYDNVNRMIGVLCLTETATNELMWTHYTQNHTGFVIEFDEGHEFFQQHKFTDDKRSRFRPVVYVSDRPQYGTLNDISWEGLCFTKGKAWEYEREWRMVLPLEKADDTRDECIYLFNLPSACISGLIFGSNMSEQKKMVLTALVKNDVRYSHVRLYQASISEIGFEIQIAELPSGSSAIGTADAQAIIRL